ncbi:solute carrier family 35 member G1 [Brienomyrus brachyistius]|uniref:solute carrier family 35 member G1 n=1 Tax=Brienomyrus brachyistius TaxID=42636 RepID=UPI0020B19B6D|nr:solute carrier family 35 member G1 [Brienomyrus brachyistius]
MEVVSKGTATEDDGDGVFSITPNEEEDVRVQVSYTAAREEELAAEIIILPDRKSHVSSDGDAARAFLDHPKSEVNAKLCHRFKYCGNESDPEAADTRGSLVSEAPGKRKGCPGLGLFYALLASTFFSVVALLVKKIEGVHAVEISAIRCFFQMTFVLPALIYYKTGFLGPRGQRIFLFLRGILGSNAMILLYYAVQQMPLADATVIVFSNPVFTTVLAWIFLKEKCTIWDFVFTIFTLTGVILIARPPFLFGSDASGIEGDYTNHVKGTIAAFLSAAGAACTLVVLRKMGKNVHYCLSVWYYAVIGLIECLIALFVIDEWTVPFCGWDRWILIVIGVLGIAGQTFLVKALQIEKAGPVALMRTIDVVLAFFCQFIFLGHSPTWWSLGGALCVISSTTGVAVRKWYSSTRKH